MPKLIHTKTRVTLASLSTSWRKKIILSAVDRVGKTATLPMLFVLQMLVKKYDGGSLLPDDE